ncbi:MAG: hypothetical protein P8L45_04535 [Longimicrobiales bacterium]|nr:hypothetical protein [Longimicrobiales bacterium]
MMYWFKQDVAETDELVQDMVLAEALQELDPGSEDRDYWLRFRSWIMTEASSELTRRRMVVQLTVEDVLVSWSRAVLPLAVAAAVAAIAFIRSPQVETTPVATVVGVEEALVVDVRPETQPVLLSPDAASGIVAFASNIF